MHKGFITEDDYAVVPYGKEYVIIHNGQQIEQCKTIKIAQNFIKKHRTSPQNGTIFVD